MPAAIHGSSKVRNWKRLQFPKVTVQYGEPMRWEPVAEPTREQQQAAADEIFGEIRGLYDGLEQKRLGAWSPARPCARAARRGARTAAAGAGRVARPQAAR